VETILIVDDEPDVRAVARDMLKVKGYTTLDTGDPTLALRIARTESQPIHLLLTDVVMPLMNGRELVEQMRTIRPAMKILYMSAYSTETVEDYGIRLAPGEPFLLKPFTMEHLVSAVRAVLDYRSPFDKRLAPQAGRPKGNDESLPDVS
jgi:two-component system, cell cycle sensor histidine kinase and response regulator CckA